MPGRPSFSPNRLYEKNEPRDGETKKTVPPFPGAPNPSVPRKKPTKKVFMMRMKKIVCLLLAAALMIGTAAAERSVQEIEDMLKQACYIYPNGGSMVHSVPDCRTVHPKYLPLTKVEYTEEIKAGYSFCPVCCLDEHYGEADAGEAEEAGQDGTEKSGHELTYFRFSRWGELMPHTWEVTLSESGCTIREDEGEPRPFAAEPAAELAQAVAEYDMEKWRGVYSTEYEVLDGECFSLQMEFADGTTVSASGDNAFPLHYAEAVRAIDDIFEREKRGTLAGIYQYEGEGFGGDFTITLNADGSYDFYEGPLSSYMGMGTWYTAFDAVYMYEGDTGFDLSFMFGIEGDSLIYLAGGSDPFPYVELADGARFIRMEEANSTAD